LDAIEQDTELEVEADATRCPDNRGSEDEAAKLRSQMAASSTEDAADNLRKQITENTSRRANTEGIVSRERELELWTQWHTNSEPIWRELYKDKEVSRERELEVWTQWHTNSEPIWRELYKVKEDPALELKKNDS